MAIVTVKGFMDEPVMPVRMVLAEYSPKGEPIILRWFDPFKL